MPDCNLKQYRLGICGSIEDCLARPVLVNNRGCWRVGVLGFLGDGRIFGKMPTTWGVKHRWLITGAARFME